MKALEALERIKQAPTIYVGCGSDVYTRYSHECKTIEKELKALEIIREKGIILQFIKETYTVEQYNAGVFGTLVKPLTQEEYDLLKEVLELL